MGSMETNRYNVKYSRRDSRYYVTLDGIKVGWVSKGHDGWSFWATTTDSIQGDRLSTEPQRGIAVEEGLSNLRIRHMGRLFHLDMDRDSDTYMKDVPMWLDNDRLYNTIDHMSSVRYRLI